MAMFLPSLRLLCKARGDKPQLLYFFFRFPGGSEGKPSACNAGDPGSIPGLGRSPGEGNGNPLQYSCLENSMDGGAWWATVYGVTESDTTEQLHLLFLLMSQFNVTVYRDKCHSTLP